MQKYFCIALSAIIAAVLVVPTTVSAFDRMQRNSIPTYDERKTYTLDTQEAEVYLEELYEKLAARASQEHDPDDAKTRLTNARLSIMLYSIIKLGYPLADSGGWEGIEFSDKVSPEAEIPIKYLVSRGIIIPDGTAANESKAVSLEEYADTLDRMIAAAPYFPVAVRTLKPKYTKEAYLTFDDNASENTVKILDSLKKYGVKATFFMAGKADPELLLRMKNEGHTIAVHTMTHDYSKIYSSTQAFWADIENEAGYIESVTGEKPTILRFPGGSNNTVSNKYSPGIMKTLISEAANYGYTYYDWNVSSKDATGKKISAEEIVATVAAQSKDRDKVMILMHQTAPKTSTAEAIPAMIEALQAMGFEILPITDGQEYVPQFISP